MLIPCKLRKINLVIQGKDDNICLPEFCNNSGYLSIDEDGNVVAYKFEPERVLGKYFENVIGTEYEHLFKFENYKGEAMVLKIYPDIYDYSFE